MSTERIRMRPGEPAPEARWRSRVGFAASGGDFLRPSISTVGASRRLKICRR